MSRKNSEYWKERFVLLEESQIQKGADYYAGLDRQFRKAAADMQKDIEVWYQRFADNNSISMSEARKILKGRELEELRWTVEDYIKYGKQNALNQKWLKQLENASARYHISRLESLQLQLQQHAEVLFGNHLDSTDKLLRNIYSEGYYRTAFEVQKGLGVGTAFDRLDTRRIDKVLSKPWTTDNRTFSDRIWSNKDKLINTVNTQITQMIIRGSSPEKAINAIAKQMNVSKSQAGRLVMTESAFFASAAQRDSFKELGVEKFEIVATLDGNTCGDCGGLEGIPIDMKDYAEGITAPPFHPNCRCVASPYFDDEFSGGGTRIARDEDGKNYDVPADMTYEQWKEKLTTVESDNLFDKMGRKMKSTAIGKDVVSYDGLPAHVKNVFAEGLKNADSMARQVLERELKSQDFFITDGKNLYNSRVNAIGIREDASASTLAHEMFHRIDKKYNITESYDFEKMLREDFERLQFLSNDDIEQYIIAQYPKAFFYNEVKNRYQVYPEYRGISDIFSGLSNNKITLGYGHNTDYWKKNENRIAKESWAQYGRILFENEVQVLNMFENIFPNFNKNAKIALKGLI